MNTEANLSDRVQSIQALANLANLILPSLDPEQWSSMTDDKKIETLRTLLLTIDDSGFESPRQAVAIFFTALVYWGGESVGLLCTSLLNSDAPDAVAQIPTSSIEAVLDQLSQIVTKSLKSTGAIR